jgi:acyl-CoA thioesterase-2
MPSDTPTNTAPAYAEPASLLDLITVSQIDAGHFLGARSADREQGLYGGHVAAQALLAAAATVEPDRVAHSLHGYFLRRGDARQDIEYEVQNDRDGRSYSARRVIARQSGRVIFNMAASFCRPENGPDVQEVSAPLTPGPDESTPLTTHLAHTDVRDPNPGAGRLHPTRVWLRCRQEIGPDANQNAAALTYVSDLFSGVTGVIDLRPDDLVTSLDHSLWFHRPIRMDEWMLMDLIGVSLAGSRGWYTGHMYDANGVALAGMAQEMVVRVAPRAT